MTDTQFMLEALELRAKLRRQARCLWAPIVVCDGRVIGRGYNSPIARTDPTAHAETIAIREAALTLRNYRLTGATLYVTMEPCVMCAGALVNARVARLVFAARDLRFGGVRSKFRLAD